MSGDHNVVEDYMSLLQKSIELSYGAMCQVLRGGILHMFALIMNK